MSGPYPEAVERFPTVRQSRLATLDRCALSAKFEEDYRYGWSGHPQARGTIFHRVAASALRQMYEQNERSIPTDAAIAILDHELRQADVDKVCPSCGKPVVKRYMMPPPAELVERGVEVGYPRIVCEAGHDHGSDFVNLPMSEVSDLRWVTVKWSHDNEFDIEGLVDVEHRLHATVRYPDGHGGSVERRLTGALDAVFVQGEEDEQFVVLDWKDTWALPGPTDVGFDGYFQQRFYAWLIFRNFPSAATVTLREFYVRFSESREATVYRADMDDIEAELSALVERFDRAFAQDVFPATPGKHCQFCPRPTACPIFPGVRTEGTITDAPTAVRFAREANVAKAALANRTKALQAWTQIKGPVEISAHKGRRGFGYKTTQRTSRPTFEQMEEAIRAKGGEVLTPDEVKALWKTTTTTKFGEYALSDIDVRDEAAEDAVLMNALEQSVKK